MYKVLEKERRIVTKAKFNRYEKKSIIMQTVSGWGFVSPVLIASLLFGFGGICFAFALTFFKGDISNLKFAGFDNWKALANPDLHLGIAFKNTLIYTGTAVPIALILSVVVAAVIRSKYVKFKKLFFAIAFLPTLTSALVSITIFINIIKPGGAIPIDWAKDPSKLIWVIVISGIWGSTAGGLIGMNTAFSVIKMDQYESASMDGAGGVRKFFRITLPSIAPILAFSLFVGIAGGFAVFGGPFLLAEGLKLDPSGLMTLALKGYQYIMPTQTGSALTNIGLGSTILFMVSLIMIGTAFITNLVFPIGKKTY